MSGTIAFNNKLAADHLDVATHFDVKLDAELASAFDGYEEKMCAALHMFEDKLATKITKYNKIFQEYKGKYEKHK